MPEINVRDVKLYYEMSGDGDPALVFVHGMCGGAWGFDEQMALLSPDFRCVAYDRRGHSRSEPGSGDQSDRTHADDLAALIDALGLEQPVVVGSSSGGVIALDLLRSRPNLVRGVVLIEPPLFSLDPDAGRRLLAEMVPKLERALADGGIHGAVDAFFREICGSYWSQLDDDRRERTFDNAHMLFPALEREAANITAGDLANVATPVAVVTGSDSPAVLRSISQTISQKLVEHLPNTRGIEIEGSGHVVYAEKPAEFAEAVRAFAREIALARSAA